MEKIGILGTGVVGNTIGSKMIALGHPVKMGSRTANNEKAVEWVSKNGANASAGTFEDAARFADIIFNCTKGEVTMEVFKQAGTDHFNGKTIIDISNPLDFSQGFPPFLTPQYSNTNSLGEEIQRLIPDAHVVKSLNIVNCEVMVNASKSGGDPTMFVAGNNEEAKIKAQSILKQFGWNDLIDLGDITNARAMEMMLPIWVRTYAATKNGYLAFKIVR
jgi:8-hydroxy-5-deazaflavin:NADPH oxidoreductase